TFHVLLQGNSWIINFKDSSALMNASVPYSGADASCDGTNIYLVRTSNPANLAGGVISQTAQIYSGVYPPTCETFTHNLWLAFASASVLSNATGKAKPP